MIFKNNFFVPQKTLLLSLLAKGAHRSSFSPNALLLCMWYCDFFPFVDICHNINQTSVKIWPKLAKILSYFCSMCTIWLISTTEKCTAYKDVTTRQHTVFLSSARTQERRHNHTHTHTGTRFSSISFARKRRSMMAQTGWDVTGFLACLVFISTPVGEESLQVGWMGYNCSMERNCVCVCVCMAKKCHHTLHSWEDKTCTHENRTVNFPEGQAKYASNIAEAQWTWLSKTYSVIVKVGFLVSPLTFVDSMPPFL